MPASARPSGPCQSLYNIPLYSPQWIQGILSTLISQCKGVNTFSFTLENPYTVYTAVGVPGESDPWPLTHVSQRLTSPFPLSRKASSLPRPHHILLVSGAWQLALTCLFDNQQASGSPFDLQFTHPWRRKWQPTPVFLPGKFHGQRSLVGYSPWGHKELDTTERLHLGLDSLTHPVRQRPMSYKTGNVCRSSCLVLGTCAQGCILLFFLQCLLVTWILLSLPGAPTWTPSLVCSSPFRPVSWSQESCSPLTPAFCSNPRDPHPAWNQSNGLRNMVCLWTQGIVQADYWIVMAWITYIMNYSNFHWWNLNSKRMEQWAL